MFTQVIARRRHMWHGVGRAQLVRARHQMMVAVLPIVFEKKNRVRERDRGMCVRRGGAHPVHHDIKSRALYKSGWSQHGTHCNTLQRTSTQRVQMWEKLCVLSHGIWKWTWGMHATCELGCTGAFQNISLFWQNERQEEYRALFRIPTVNPQSKRKRWREIKKNSSVPKDFLKIAHWNLLCLNDRLLSTNRIEESSDLFCIKRLEISDCNFNFEEPPFLTPKDKRIEKVLQNKRWEFWRLGRGNEVRHRLPSLN